MAKITVENWETFKVIKTKSIILDTEELRQNFVEFENMSDVDICKEIEDYDGIIGGEHLREFLIHEREDEREDLISDVMDAGTTVFME